MAVKPASVIGAAAENFLLAQTIGLLQNNNNLASLVLGELRMLRKDFELFMADFTQLSTIMQKLRDDVAAEVAAGIAAIQNSGASDQAQVDAAVASFQTIDKAITDGTAAFQAAVAPPNPPATGGTSTQTNPPATNTAPAGQPAS